jgi:hypothetical protein
MTANRSPEGKGRKGGRRKRKIKDTEQKKRTSKKGTSSGNRNGNGK